MLVGEGPGIEESKTGVPFVGKSGKLLRTVLAALKLEDVYITNIVACRSCEPAVDAAGLPRMRMNYKTKQKEMVFQDTPPPPVCSEACSPRLYEEIYLVDPIAIIGLGATACEMLMQRPVTITRMHGQPTFIEVPGAVHRPSLTPAGKWARKSLGLLNAPTEQNQVAYYFMPTLHPAFILRQIQDEDPRSYFHQFYADISMVARTYSAYLETVLGAPPMVGAPDSDVVWEQYMKSIQEENNDG